MFQRQLSVHKLKFFREVYTWLHLPVDWQPDAWLSRGLMHAGAHLCESSLIAIRTLVWMCVCSLNVWHLIQTSSINSSCLHLYFITCYFYYTYWIKYYSNTIKRAKSFTFSNGSLLYRIFTAMKMWEPATVLCYRVKQCKTDFIHPDSHAWFVGFIVMICCWSFARVWNVELFLGLLPHFVLDLI